MPKTNWMTLTFLCAFLWLAPPQVESQEEPVGRAWFGPSLTIDQDAACASVLATAQERFMTTESLGFFSAPPQPYALGNLTPRHDDTYWRNARVTIDDKPFYVTAKRHPGCGGGCESYSFVASTTLIEDLERLQQRDEPALPETPAVKDYEVYQNDANSFYVAQHDEGDLTLYRLTGAGQWHLACSIAVTPTLDASGDEAIDAVLRSIDALLVALGDVRREEADCGSAHFHSQRTQYMTRSLRRTLFRPWAILLPERSAAALPQLVHWALLGEAERVAYENFVRQRDETLEAIVEFYQQKFGWDATHAREVATIALTGAIEHGFGSITGLFGNGEEGAVRKAIAARMSIAEIAAIGATKEQLTYRPDAFSFRADSILNLAVTYPQALRYLLELGLDPNVVNPFGKTPLMYAAQYDQIESMRILFEYGADPNAVTTAPQDRCTYALETSGVSALHYAVRFASAQTVELLLAHGAVPYARAGGRNAGTAREWLERYTARESAERNQKLTTGDAERLALKLNPPTTAAERASAANELALQAEALYASGDVAGAYRKLRVALLAQPDHVRSLNDFSLIALKHRSLGESMQASTFLIQLSPESAQLASAWFNLALACDAAPFHQRYYNGMSYCLESPVNRYLNAWKAKPTKASATKLAVLFDSQDASVCAITTRDGVRLRLKFGDSPDTGFRRPRVYTLYALHAADAAPTDSSLEWQQSVWNRQAGVDEETRVLPKLVGRHEMEGFGVSEFNLDYEPRSPVQIGDGSCKIQMNQ